jgi:hypothetical protein
MINLVKRNITIHSSIFLLIIILSFSFLIAPSASKGTELVKNGGFEDSLDNWNVFSYYPEHDDKAVITDSKPHYGRYSLETGIINESQDHLGRGARQTINLEQCSDLKLSFWVYLGSVAGSQNLYTDVALIVTFLTEKNPKAIVYYVAWDPQEEIYDGFPTPTMNSEDVTNILIPAMMTYRWNHVERDLARDFKNAHPSLDLRTVSSLSIELVSVRFEKIDFVSETFWDDISLTCEVEETASWDESPTPNESSEEIQQTTTATDQTPNPIEEFTQTTTTVAPPKGDPTSTSSKLTETPKKENESRQASVVDYWTPLTALATIMGTLLAMLTLFFTFRRRH